MDACMPLLGSMDSPPVEKDGEMFMLWILGMPLFRQYFTNFEFDKAGKQTVYMAPNKYRNCRSDEGEDPHGRPANSGAFEENVRTDESEVIDSIKLNEQKHQKSIKLHSKP